LSFPPLSAWKHHPVADQEAGGLAAATLEYQRRFDFDFVKLTPASSWQLRDQGLEDAWRGDFIGRRVIVRQPVEEPGDWMRLRSIAPDFGFAAEIVEAAALVRSRLPSEVPLVATIFDPLFQAATLTGLDRFQRHYDEHRDCVECGMAIIVENTVRLVRSFAERGVEGIFFATQHAQESALKADRYAGMGLSALHACMEAARGLPFNFLHLHGTGVHARLFEDLAGTIIHYDAVPGNPAPEQVTAECISTGPAPEGPILSGTPTAVRHEVADLLHRLRGRKCVLAPGCALPLAAPDANVAAMVDAVRHARRMIG
jgi:uroporphyrinogen decarboxylase